MFSKMFLVVLNIVVLFSCLIQSSSALKCYQCDSSRNSKCNDLADKSTNGLQPTECVADTFLNQATGILSNLGLGGQSNSAREAYTPVCLKVVIRNSTHNTITRQCAFKIQSQDPCALAKSAVQQYANINVQNPVEFCGACDNADGCNSADSMKLFSALVVFGTMLSTARLFA